MTQNSQTDRRTLLTGTVAAAAATILPAPLQAQNRPRTHALIGQPSPEISLPLFGGGRFERTSLIGKTTIVQFWGLWCPDCLLDVDHVNQLNRRIARERGMALMTVHTRGRYGRWGGLAPFFAEKRYTLPVAVDDDSTAYRAWQLAWVPSFLIVDRNGIIRDYSADLEAGDGIGVGGLIRRARAVGNTYRA